MKKMTTLLLVVLTVSLSAWITDFDANSKLHIGACYTLNAMGHIVSKMYITENRVWNSIIGGTFAMAVGVKKEYDDIGSWDFDEKNYVDLRDDFIGTSLSIITMQLFEPINIYYKDEMIYAEVRF